MALTRTERLPPYAQIGFIYATDSLLCPSWKRVLVERVTPTRVYVWWDDKILCLNRGLLEFDDYIFHRAARTWFARQIPEHEANDHE